MTDNMQTPLERAARALAEELGLHLDLDDASFDLNSRKVAVYHP